MFFTNNFDQVCVQRKQDKKAFFSSILHCTALFNRNELPSFAKRMSSGEQDMLGIS